MWVNVGWAMTQWRARVWRVYQVIGAMRYKSRLALRGARLSRSRGRAEIRRLQELIHGVEKSARRQ